MNFIKSSLAVAALAFVGLHASATPITVDGVTFNPGDLSVADFSAQSLNIRQFINPVSGEVTGLGIATSIDGNLNFCNNCQLLFAFGGLLPATVGALPGTTPGSSITYHGGFVNFYVVPSNTVVNPAVFGSLTPALLTKLTEPSATPGALDTNLWLSTNVLDGFVGTVLGGKWNLSGNGYLNATGGAAYHNLHTGTIDNGQGGFADLGFSTSFTKSLTGSLLDTSGTGNVSGWAIPEPESFALAGLALIAMYFARGRNRKLDK